jgi:hypothetical protein
MLIDDRVYCDCCGNDMGKLMALPAPLIEKLPSIGDEAPDRAELILEKDDAPAIA